MPISYLVKTQPRAGVRSVYMVMQRRTALGWDRARSKMGYDILLISPSIACLEFSHLHSRALKVSAPDMCFEEC